MNPLCVYHSNCADGFTAAWVVNKFFNGNVDFYPGVYQQQPPPETANRHVIFVDFSYKKEVMYRLAKHTKGVLMLDHHKTAIDDLSGSDDIFTDMTSYENELSWRRFIHDCYQDSCEGSPSGRIYTLFDLERSGAGLAWDFFFPKQARPKFVDHVEDRDLWRFNLPYTREIQAAIFSFEYTFENWNQFENDAFFLTLANQGRGIERKHFKDIKELLTVVTRPMKIDGQVVPMANLPYTLTSDAGHILAEGHPFAGCYWDTPAGRVFSLRSRPEGADVSVIARKYGGGGHVNASGFTVPYDQLEQFNAD